MGSGRKRCGDSILGQLVGILCDLNSRADRLGVKTDDKWQAGLKKLVAPVEISFRDFRLIVI